MTVAFDLLETLGEKAGRALVSEARRVVEGADLGDLPGRATDLLAELSPGGDVERLAGDVELARRKLEDHLVDRAPVLADHQHGPPVVQQRNDHHGARVADEVPLEGEAVWIEGGPRHEAEE